MARRKMTEAEKKAFAERMRKARAAKSKKTSAKTTKRKTTKRNPVGGDVYIIKIEGKNGATGYLQDYLTTGAYTDSLAAALVGPKKCMESIARLMQIVRPLGLKSVEVVKKN